MRVTLLISLLLNTVLVVALFAVVMEGESTPSGGTLGVLKQDVEVGFFDHPDSLFTIPKGLIVRDCSATGMGWFEPHRFSIVVTSDEDDLIDFSSVPLGSAELYSADRNPIGPTTPHPAANKPEQPSPTTLRVDDPL